MSLAVVLAILVASPVTPSEAAAARRPAAAHVTATASVTILCAARAGEANDGQAIYRSTRRSEGTMLVSFE